MSGTLVVVATPIGNLDDLSPRAARALEQADLIACEDTRVTRKLLSRVRSHAALIAYHARNERARIPELVRRVASGSRVALVTDAGTPGLSDPGQRLIAACAESGLRVEVIPGPSAAVAALVASGLPSARFVFEGFLPRTHAARRRRLERLSTEERTLVIFEAPHRLADSLADMVEVLGDRPAALARELTKMHEEVARGTLSDLTARAREGVRGEVTLVIAGAPPTSERGADPEVVAEMIHAAMEEGLTRKDAVARVAAELGVPKNEVYRVAIAEQP